MPFNAIQLGPNIFKEIPKYLRHLHLHSYGFEMFLKIAISLEKLEKLKILFMIGLLIS